MRRLVKSVGYLSVLILTVMASGAPPASNAFETKKFDLLPEEKKLAVILAALDWRDQNLQNFHYEVEETLTVEQTFLWQIRYEVKRIGDRNWMHIDRYKLSGSLPVNQSWCEWDGKTQKILAEQGGRKTATIADRETPHLRELYYNDLLGFRMERYRLTTPAWIRLEVDKVKRPYNIKVSGTDHEPLVLLHVNSGPHGELDEIWLDPSRDYMIVHHHWSAPGGAINSPSSYIDGIVVAASNKSGLWVPTETRREIKLAAAKGKTDWFRYHVTRFERDVVKENELAVALPRGTQVLDTVQKRNYMIDEGGSIHPGVYYDAPTGQVFGPGGELLTKPTTTPTSQPVPGIK